MCKARCGISLPALSCLIIFLTTFSLLIHVDAQTQSPTEAELGLPPWLRGLVSPSKAAPFVSPLSETPDDSLAALTMAFPAWLALEEDTVTGTAAAAAGNSGGGGGAAAAASPTEDEEEGSRQSTAAGTAADAAAGVTQLRQWLDTELDKLEAFLQDWGTNARHTAAAGGGSGRGRADGGVTSSAWRPEQGGDRGPQAGDLAAALGHPLADGLAEWLQHAANHPLTLRRDGDGDGERSSSNHVGHQASPAAAAAASPPPLAGASDPGGWLSDAEPGAELGSSAAASPAVTFEAGVDQGAQFREAPPGDGGNGGGSEAGGGADREDGRVAGRRRLQQNGNGGGGGNGGGNGDGGGNNGEGRGGGGGGGGRGRGGASATLMGSNGIQGFNRGNVRPVRDALAGALLNNPRPRTRATERLLQLFHIVQRDIQEGNVPFTGGRVQRRCESQPYVFKPRVPNALPQQYVGPSFYITRTTGNCVLRPDISALGINTWTVLYERLACLSPSRQYLLLPAVYSGPGDQPESFQCPQCVPVLRLGRQVDISFSPGGQGTLRSNTSFMRLSGGAASRARKWMVRNMKTYLKGVRQEVRQSGAMAQLVQQADVGAFAKAAAQLLAASADADGSGGHGSDSGGSFRHSDLTDKMVTDMLQGGVRSHRPSGGAQGGLEFMAAAATPLAAQRLPSNVDGAAAEAVRRHAEVQLRLQVGGPYPFPAVPGVVAVPRPRPRHVMQYTASAGGLTLPYVWICGLHVLLWWQNSLGSPGALVLELGGGVGLVGVAAAAVCRHAVITDVHQGALTLAAANVNDNAELIRELRRRRRQQQNGRRRRRWRRRPHGDEDSIVDGSSVDNVDKADDGRENEKGRGRQGSGGGGGGGGSGAEGPVLVDLCQMDWFDFLAYGSGGVSVEAIVRALRADAADSPTMETTAAATAVAAAAAANEDHQKNGVGWESALGAAGVLGDELGVRVACGGGVSKVLDAVATAESLCVVAADTLYDTVLTEAFVKCAAALMSYHRSVRLRPPVGLSQGPDQRFSNSASRRRKVDGSADGCGNIGGIGDAGGGITERNPRLIVSLEKRINFVVKDLAAAAPAFDDFMSYVVSDPIEIESVAGNPPTGDDAHAGHDETDGGTGGGGTGAGSGAGGCRVGTEDGDNRRYDAGGSGVTDGGGGGDACARRVMNAVEGSLGFMSAERPSQHGEVRVPLFRGRRLDVSSVPQVLQYDRCEQLELWELTLL
ncbi:hypothetical protein VOLCADRAFT_105356 [Volvox carteri f. nagariensis]|uniref:Uncharacterized protein n=1 Tax=Volvox carteri f. nagariensis TaxID=3068 RepID=D8U0B8_VOLCA|nr:uncharacterized protein VOLCADRAFT_105356 [Volvox carteri f. nagariensis]EFJ46834.1 hypothetical protein VOLCADRAFT_105356 [Volvox carteri f. nagariensis]|eukprot:XP_002952043.1 hypothetical protein VOLCADRAFT_105356 [Volvox carteri f. nagariensis]